MAKFKHGIQQKKKTRQQRKAHMIRRLKRNGKTALRAKVGEIFDPELMTADILKKRRTSPRANITLSGKKKRKILKQIRYNSAKTKQMEVCPVEVQKPTIREVQMSEPPRRERRHSETIEMADIGT
jgi:hypothetical protein